eukprot:scaffold23424_cov57-Attheya_sp.AAC.1
MAEATTAPMADRARQEMEELVEQGGNLTPEQQRQLLQYAAGAILSSILLKVVFQAMFYVYIVALPLVYLYCVQTCPSNESFDAKKELKRVLRGHHLPENHPDKPKGFLTNALNRVQATVATEVATGLGYENILGAFTIAFVNVTSVERDLFWIGILGEWRYLYQRESIPATNNT